MRALLPIQAHTMCSGYAEANSVSRLARRFWNSFGHDTTDDPQQLRAKVSVAIAVTVDEKDGPRFGTLESVFREGPQHGIRAWIPAGPIVPARDGSLSLEGDAHEQFVGVGTA